MKIAVTTPSDEFELYGLKGGNQRIAEAMVKNINKYTSHNAVNVFIPLKIWPMGSLAKSYIANYCIDFSDYDLVISSKFPSWVTNHPNHICFFAHGMRQFYDWWPEWKKQVPLYYMPFVLTTRYLTKTIDHYYLKKAKKVYAYSKFLQHRLKHEMHIESELLFSPSFIENFKTGEYKYILSPCILNDERKRISLIIKAMSYIKNKNIRLKIAGDGPSKIMLQDLAKGDSRIEFLGYQPEEKLVDLYANALCVPFVSYIEDHGLVTIESYMSSKPVITCTDSGGPLSFVKENETGFICEPNAQKIGEKINFFIDHPDEAKKMGEAGYNIVKDITWENIIKKLIGDNLYYKQDKDA